MKNVIIIGASGFGKEIYSYIQDDISKGFFKDSFFKGFIDDNEENFNSLQLKDVVAFLGSTDKYKYDQNDYVIVAIGNIGIRNKIINKLELANVKFYNYIHNSVLIAFDSMIEKGIIICPNSIIQSNSVLEAHCVLNIYTSVGHDSRLGKGSVLSPYCTLNGNVHTGDHLFMGTRSSILLNSNIGNNCTISAHTNVSGTVEDAMIIKDMKTQKQVKNRLI